VPGGTDGETTNQIITPAICTWMRTSIARSTLSICLLSLID
jgi:hypothetical protein